MRCDGLNARDIPSVSSFKYVIGLELIIDSTSIDTVLSSSKVNEDDSGQDPYHPIRERVNQPDFAFLDNDAIVPCQ